MPPQPGRRDTDMAAWFSELDELARAVGSRRVLVDGELVALDAAGRPDFAALQQRTLARPRSPTTPRRATPPGTAPVLYVIFDLLGVDGRLLLDRP
jgi:bifunctional non-homologous end joining protein LigD